MSQLTTENVSTISWVHNFLPYVVNSIPNDLASALDIGIGYGYIGYMLRKIKKIRRLDGIEIWYPYISDVKRHKIYDQIYIGDVLSEIAKIPNRTYDASIMLEVIEHIEKDRGKKILDELDRITKKFIIVSTPCSYFSSSPWDSNHYQLHRSVWTIKDFKSRGYRVRGHGLKVYPMKKLLYHMLQSFSFYFPSIAEYLIAWKKLDR
jgi:hypothetical protein